MKYKMLKDTPWGNAGSEWILIQRWETEKISAMENERGERIGFPINNFSIWFSEIEEVQKFTREQAEAIKKQLKTHPFGTPTWRQCCEDFETWLDENTLE